MRACPYCGKHPEVRGEGLGYVIQCQTIWEHNVSVYGKTPAEAIARWADAFEKLPWWVRFINWFGRR